MLLQIAVLCVGVALLTITFMVVLNSTERSSPLYPGSNVRFLASVPTILLLLLLAPWLVTAPPEIDVLRTVGLIVLLVLYVLYHAWVESRFRGGPAKRAMKAVVVDKNGKAVSFKRALTRNIVKLLLLPLAPLNIYFVIKDFRHQALHDKAAGTFVMWSPEAIRERQPKSSYEVDIQ